MATLPAASPVTLAEAKHHLRITHDLSDPEIAGYLLAAIEYVEVRAQRIFMDRQLTLVLDDFPGTDSAICFDLSPVDSVDTIQYYDEDNASQTLTLTNYILYADAEGIALGRGTQDAPASSGEVVNLLGNELHQSAVRITVGEEQPVISIPDTHNFPP